MGCTVSKGALTAKLPAFGIAVRAAALLLVWLALTDGRRADLFVGFIIVGFATFASIRLRAPSSTQPDFAALFFLTLRFFSGSLKSGWDVARRALGPRPHLDPVEVFYPVRLPHGPARDAFRAIMSLQPGTLPMEAEDKNGFRIHCLDKTQPVLATFAAEETAFARALGISLAERAQTREPRR